jgi:hypothetical protein
VRRCSNENGTVIVRCPGCDNLHLVAGNLGWFLDGPEGYNIETILATKGQSVRRAADDEEDAAEFLPDGTIHVKKSWQIKSQRHSPRGKSQCRPVAKIPGRRLSLAALVANDEGARPSRHAAVAAGRRGSHKLRCLLREDHPGEEMRRVGRQ